MRIIPKSLWLIGGASIALAGIIAAGCYVNGRATSPSGPHARPAGDDGPTAARPIRVGDDVRVGAWNIEWLGTPGSRSGPARGRAQEPNDLAAYIVAARVDILGLEEIASDDADGPWTSSIVSQTLRQVSRETGGQWRHQLYPAHSGRNQVCGVAWDASRVAAVGDPVLITKTRRDSSQGKPLWSRPAVGQLFSAGPGLSDFLVVVCHNKSDYGGSFAVHRGEEADLFLSELPAANGDPDILLIGDMNCQSSSEPLVQRFIAAGFVNLNHEDIPTHVRYGALDRAFAPANQPEFAARHFEVCSTAFLGDRNLTHEDFKVRFSDHFMVLTTIRIMADDD
ncbi:MAG: hypothetical protein LC135_06645 [Phycisphaerae bacterium]|nr:hypothetical protein [Phycisphaerae bacterium]MCZ2399533.1 hypothetical protein [Phycisphaerae bacterium]